MRILLATVKVPFIKGGAELLAGELFTELENAGHRVDMVEMPFKWYPPEVLVDSMLSSACVDLTEANGQATDLVIGLKFPAYLARCRKMNLWLLHQHRQAYELWGTEFGDLEHAPNGRATRELIQRADVNALSAIERRFTISRNVSNRLLHYSGIDSKPLYHPPPGHERFHSERQGDYLFFPSRVNRTKRQELAIEAMAHTQSDVRLVIAGQSDHDDYARHVAGRAQQLGVEGKVEFRGPVTEEEKISLYANCLGVLYPPYNEDYGYITLEGILSRKPVISCTDSGGPSEFIESGVTGLLTEPSPLALAVAMDALFEDRQGAARMGEAGRQSYSDKKIGWENVVDELTQ